MSRFQHILSYLLFALHILLLFLLVFQEKVNIPIGLQTIGRMHPMVLHLPIGLLLVQGYFGFVSKNLKEKILRNSLVCASYYSYYCQYCCTNGFLFVKGRRLYRKLTYLAQILLA
jgi:hypothetical protein